MARFTDIVGQEQLKEHLQNAIATNKVSHAYIINGERNAGKEFIARVFAMTLQCEKGETEPCGECHSCKQALGNNQPDIIYISHEKPNTIGVEDIRVQINGDIAIKPYSSPRKIYIINEGEKMTPQAQNALLKTLEEPPEYAVILILTTNVEAMLPTVLSRCVVLNMKPVSDRLVKKYLMEQLAVPDYKANISVAFARGNIGKAKMLASSEEFEKVKDEAITLVKNINDMEISEIVKAIKKISEYKFDVNDYLDILMAWYRDVLLFKATKDVNSLVFKEDIQQIMRMSDRSTYEGIEQIVNALQSAKKRLEANVNFDLTMELLFLAIKEN
ncbi:MAG: DNA polymerase III subunit delta [Lachnospiraceae bacterium]|nr:DNA polymerase III subunit delta [Lachnospiraceae bacterium]